MDIIPPKPLRLVRRVIVASTREGSGLRPFLWIRDQWGSGQGAWCFFVGAEKEGGMQSLRGAG